MAKTIAEINEKIASGDVVVVTAEEIIDIVGEDGPEKAAEKVDVVTTGTFGPMCSSGAFLNFGHANPRIKVTKAWLNGVNAYAGLAAVDLYVGATEMPETDPLNATFPGDFAYGGGHVIEDLVAGKDVRLKATAYGTDCYPSKGIDNWVNIETLNEAVLHNPRNAYQNYNCAVNLSKEREIYTYMGVLKPDLGSANFCSAGQLSPLLCDPHYKTIGIGTRIFLGGGEGYVTWWGTQHNPGVARHENGVVKGGAGTLTVTGDLKQMKEKWLRGVSFRGYGSSLQVGLGVPIPLLNAEIAQYTAVKDSEITAPVTDYSRGYPYFDKDVPDLGSVTYAELRTGKVNIQGKEVPTASLSSYPRAVEIAEELKDWIATGNFFLGQSVQPLPSADSGYAFTNLPDRPVTNGGGR